MLQLTPQSVIYVATIHVDFRKGIDGLAAICRQKFTREPLNGALFLFYNKSKTTIKILAYDGQGMWLCTKRLSTGKFTYKITNTDSHHQQICYRSLYILLNNGNPNSADLAKDWKSLMQH
ncbi:MAG: putative transposition helper protein [Bacteroidota bacterium]|jgi:transposase